MSVKRAAEYPRTPRKGSKSSDSLSNAQQIEAKQTVRGRQRHRTREAMEKGKAADVWRAETMQPHSDTAILVSVSNMGNPLC